MRTTAPSVPQALRDWSVPWPDYAPIDVTPEGIAASGWAEPYTDPTDVPDWPARLAEAMVPYELAGDGWPLNPAGRTGKAGRQLPRWGENAAADPIVVADEGVERRVLLIQRGDTREWAIPGGKVDPGETVASALTRELLEETGVDLRHEPYTVLSSGYIEDPRATDHSWISSTAALFRLPDVVPARGADDAIDAAWWPLTDLERLTTALESRGGLYEAHRPLLAAALAASDRA